jgi:hypothetical protein
MNQTEKEKLVSILKTHLDQIYGLQYGSFQAAETLYQRTKMFAEKYFQAGRYGRELIGIKFRSGNAFFENHALVWDTGKTKLASIAQAMLDELILTKVAVPAPVVKVVEDTKKVDALQQEVAKLQEQLQTSEADLAAARAELSRFKDRSKIQKKMSAYLLAFLLCSIILWSLNSWVKWHWLSQHPKRIGIYLSVQVLILLGFSVAVFRLDSSLKITIFTAMFIAAVVGLLQLI